MMLALSALFVILCLQCCFAQTGSTHDVLRELQTAMCLLDCREDNTSESCSCDNPGWDLKTNEKLTEPELLCKNENSITFRLPTSAAQHEVLAVQRLKHNLNASWTFQSMKNEHRVVTISDLEPNAEYKFRFYGLKVLSDSRQLLEPAETDWYNTWSEGSMPLTVNSISVDSLQIIDDNYEAKITWIPATDFSCFYDFVWFSTSDVSDYRQLEIREPQSLFTITLNNLQYDSNYSVAVTSKSADWLRESAKKWVHITTPTCLDEHGSLDRCAPAKPANLSATEIFKLALQNVLVYDIILEWTSPKFVPINYTLSVITVINSEEQISTLNISGNSTEAIFEDVAIGLYYHVTMTAWSNAGPSIPSVLNREINGTVTNIIAYDTWSPWDIILKVFVPILLVFSLLLAALVACSRYERKKHIAKVLKTFMKEKPHKLELTNPHYLETVLINDLEHIVPDGWEIQLDHLKVEAVLGHGAFGVVRKGWLNSSDYLTEVAIKMLREYPTSEDVRQFKQEIEIMKSVGSHPHIVSMLGCCTNDVGYGPYLVVEYCARGDLQSYLRSAWETLVNNKIQIKIDCDVQVSRDEFANKLYDLGINEKDILHPADLLSLSRQIALGMDYLSSLRVVHRDLAARNILVCEDRTVKVSDFGLSRDVYQDNVYFKSTSGKLPIKWMALESLTHQVYTTQSDVWSFGVLLWEMATLGGNPYPAISTPNLLSYLKDGNRMAKPNGCNDELYDLMLHCWRTAPLDRPTFSELISHFDIMLESMIPYIHFDMESAFTLNAHTEKSCKNTENGNANRYVKAIK